MNRTLTKRPTGTCALCCLDKTQLWTMVTANMVTVWLDKHNLPSRDSIAKQKSASFKYRNVWVCRFCAQQFSIDSSRHKGTTGPGHSDLSPERQKKIQDEATKIRLPFNVHHAKKMYQLSISSTLRFIHEEKKEKAEKKRKIELEEAEKEQKEQNRRAGMIAHQPSNPSHPTYRKRRSSPTSGRTLTRSGGIGGEEEFLDNMDGWSEDVTNAHDEDVDALLSVSSISCSKNDEKDNMDQQIKLLKEKRRKIMAENALNRCCDSRIHAEEIRDPGTMTLNACEQLKVTGMNASKTAVVFKGRWWGLSRMPHRHCETQLKFKGGGKKFVVGKNTISSSLLHRTSATTNTTNALLSMQSTTSTPRRPFTISSNNVTTSTGYLATRSRRPTSATRARRVVPTPRSSKLNRSENAARRPSSARPSTSTKSLRSSRLLRSSKLSTSASSKSTTIGCRQRITTKGNHSYSRGGSRKDDKKHLSFSTSFSIVSSKKRQREKEERKNRRREKVKHVKERADEQVRRQHAHCDRLDEHERRSTSNSRLDSGQSRESPEKLHRWFAQASCSFDPAAVLMSHAREMPHNNDLMVGIFDVIAREHSAGADDEKSTNQERTAAKYVSHGFAKHAVSFLQRTSRSPTFRRESYLALSICAQTEATALIVCGLVEALTDILSNVVSQATCVARVEKKEKNEMMTPTTLTTSMNHSMSHSIRGDDVDYEFNSLCRLLDLLLDTTRDGDGNAANEADDVLAMAKSDIRHTLSEIPMIRKVQVTLWSALKSKTMQMHLTTHSILSAENLLEGLSMY